MEVKSRRVGGATYQVPLEVDPARSESLAMRWIVNYARNRKGVPMHKALANEIKEAANNQGSSVRKGALAIQHNLADQFANKSAVVTGVTTFDFSINAFTASHNI